MATINSNGQSYLESQGIEARKEQMGRSDYNPNNKYSEKHSDALASSGKGKGTGDFGGHGYTVPDMTKSKSEMNYKNFSTTGSGNECDQKAREVMTARNIYGPTNRYGIEVMPDTSKNVQDGQYDGSQMSKIAYLCPVS